MPTEAAHARSCLSGQTRNADDGTRQPLQSAYSTSVNDGVERWGCNCYRCPRRRQPGTRTHSDRKAKAAT